MTPPFDKKPAFSATFHVSSVEEPASLALPDDPAIEESVSPALSDDSNRGSRAAPDQPDPNPSIHDLDESDDADAMN